MDIRKQIPIITLLFALILTSAAAQNSGQRAVLIGIDQYGQDSQISPLRSAASDARKLGSILSRNGYECQIMVDEEATEEQITEAFIQLEQQTSQNGELDVLLVYFSGRGTRIADDIQADEALDQMDECILPSDAAAGNTRTYIRDDALVRWVNAIRAKQAILIIDCAFRGDDEDPSVKGIGILSETGDLDGIEITDGLPSSAVIFSAGSPKDGVRDGAYTEKMLEALVTEDADKDGDRIISLAEAHGYAKDQLQGQQSPRLVGSTGLLLGPLPPLSRLRIESDPLDAEIQIKAGSQELQLNKRTPAIIPLKHGKYEVLVRKPGFLTPKPKEVTITEYDKEYDTGSFKLQPIAVIGQVKTANGSGNNVSLENGILNLNVKQADKQIFSEAIRANGHFRLSPQDHQWLEVGAGYELHVTGQPVITSKPANFKYDGYEDIQLSMKVTVDDMPPVISEDGISFQAAKLVAGEKISGSVRAKDAGLGMADTIEIKLQPPGEQKPVSIPAPNIRFQKLSGDEGTYEFSLQLPDESDIAGKWRVASVTIQDKAGNEAEISGDQFSVSFLVFESHYALGRHYFDAESYKEALSHLSRVSPQTDDALYLASLAHYQENDLDSALAMFRQIDSAADYVGNSRKEDMPRMPRSMVNKLWGELLKELKDHRDDLEYIVLMAATAEELGRDYDAKIYREHAERLRGRK